MGASFADQQPITKEVVRIITRSGTSTRKGQPDGEPGEYLGFFETREGTRVHEILQKEN